MNKKKMHHYHVKIVNGVTLHYAYSDLIALESPEGLLMRENEWSSTVGRYLVSINPDPKIRINKEEFLKKQKKIFTKYKINSIFESWVGEP